MVKPFTFGDDTPKERRRKSNKQEERLAGLVGGRAQAGSGAMWGAKGDVKASRSKPDENSFLYENKRTDKESYSLSAKVWNEIRQKAMLAESGRKPAMHIEVGKEKLRLVVLSEDDFLELLGEQ